MIASFPPTGYRVLLLHALIPCPFTLWEGSKDEEWLARSKGYQTDMFLGPAVCLLKCTVVPSHANCAYALFKHCILCAQRPHHLLLKTFSLSLLSSSPPSHPSSTSPYLFHFTPRHILPRPYPEKLTQSTNEPVHPFTPSRLASFQEAASSRRTPFVRQLLRLRLQVLATSASTARLHTNRLLSWSHIVKNTVSFLNHSIMTSLYMSNWERSHASVAFSVAESALESPSLGQSMASCMDTPPVCEEPAPIGAFPRLRHKSSRPLWDVVDRAKERREKRSRWSQPPWFTSDLSDSPPVSPKPTSYYTRNTALGKAFDDSCGDVAPLVATASSFDSASFRMDALNKALPRLTAREFASNEGQMVASATRSANNSPSNVLRAQATHRSIARLPSLAQIQAKMTVRDHRRVNDRSDSLDSADSDGPQTPTDEYTSFNFVPMTPESPPRESRLAPFLRERTTSRLARPKSMPPNYDIFPPSPESPAVRSRPAPLRASRQSSLPGTPQSARIRSNRRSWTADNDFSTPSRYSIPGSPTSPTESEHSAVSSTFSLPIITCTPAGEADSDEESEGDVIVFAGDFEDMEEVLEEEVEERREREQISRQMLFRLSRRSS